MRVEDGGWGRRVEGGGWRVGEDMPGVAERCAPVGAGSRRKTGAQLPEGNTRVSQFSFRGVIGES
jgi:hypothetical protein